MRPSVVSLRTQTGLALSGLLLLVAACAPMRSAPEVAPVAVAASAPVVVVRPEPPPVKPDLADAAARRLIAYHEQLRQMPPPELAQEVNRLNNVLSVNGAATSPADVLELALALAQTRNNGDLGRALALVDPITRSSAPEVQPWQGLARLLAARFAEQRRLEEQVERQANQLRDSQRTVQQLNEKLEALKAIERSLNARPAPAPGSAPRAP